MRARCVDSPSDFESIMQTDFILYIRAAILRQERWVPQTLVYKALRRHAPFRAFAKARSKNQFEALAKYLSIKTKGELDAFIAEIANGQRWVPQWAYGKVDVAGLSDHVELCTLP